MYNDIGIKFDMIWYDIWKGFLDFNFDINKLSNFHEIAPNFRYSQKL